MSTQKRYAIGQVVYVFVPEKYTLAPFRIAEESVRKTLQGEEVSYKLLYGTQGKLYDLQQFLAVNAQIFESLRDAHAALMTQAKSSIDKVVGEAGQKAQLWYPQAMQQVQAPQAPQMPQMPSMLPFDPTEEPEGEATTEVMLPDGTIRAVRANVTVAPPRA